jgi:hypothetical protein
MPETHNRALVLERGKKRLDPVVAAAGIIVPECAALLIRVISWCLAASSWLLLYHHVSRLAPGLSSATHALQDVGQRGLNFARQGVQVTCTIGGSPLASKKCELLVMLNQFWLSFLSNSTEWLYMTLKSKSVLGIGGLLYGALYGAYRLLSRVCALLGPLMRAGQRLALRQLEWIEESLTVTYVAMKVVA